MFRPLSSALALLAALVLLAVAATGVSAAAAPRAAAIGAFELKGSNGYELFGLIGTDGEGGGSLMLFVGKKGEVATYLARGEATEDSAHFDLGALGEINVIEQATGKTENLRSRCGSKPVTTEGEEFVGTIDFHGEEGFTEAEATRTPRLLKPILDLVCGGVVSSTETGAGLAGARMLIKRAGGPTLQLDQNHPRAPVFYEAKLSEKEGAVHVNRTVVGRLGGGALSYEPSLGAATFTGAGPFTGKATYTGRSLPNEVHPGWGTWRGDLKVDFPGHAAVPLTGPGFKAAIVHGSHRGPFG